MGLIFVLIIHLIGVFIIASVFAVIGLVITLFTNKNKRKRKIFLSITIPYLFLYSLYFFALIGSITVAVTKNVDIGIGDAWRAPIDKDYSIEMIDIPDNGFIRYKNDYTTFVSDIVELEYLKLIMKERIVIHF